MAVAVPPVSTLVAPAAVTVPFGATQPETPLAASKARTPAKDGLTEHARYVPSSVEKGTRCRLFSVKKFQPNDARYFGPVKLKRPSWLH